MTSYLDEIEEALASAKRLEHPDRLVRITLECAHYRLMLARDCLGGIGWSTACNICPPSPETGYRPARLIVNQEETGVL